MTHILFKFFYLIFHPYLIFVAMPAETRKGTLL